jgi:uncharacterized peroxidase-related enzyme
MSFINTTSPNEAQGELRAMYDRQQAKFGYVPNYAKVFSHRPEIMRLWADLLVGIRRHIEPRRFELVTFAAAQELGSSYCSLAHGKALMKFFSNAEIRQIVRGGEDGPLTPAETAMTRVARKVVRSSSSVSAEDIDELKTHGLDDGDIFDIIATAAGRAFFANLCEGLGALPDAAFLDLDDTLRSTLTIGRPIDPGDPERLSVPAS